MPPTNCRRLAPDLSHHWLTHPVGSAHAAERLLPPEPLGDFAEAGSADWQTAWIDLGGEG